MLDQNDVMLLKGMMESVMDEKLVGMESSILAKVDEKLADMESSILAKVDEKLADMESSILAKVDEKLTLTENLILGELERTRNILEEKIQKVQQNVDELDQYYRIKKLEDSNQELYAKRLDNLEDRVTKLEMDKRRSSLQVTQEASEM